MNIFANFGRRVLVIKQTTSTNFQCGYFETQYAIGSGRTSIVSVPEVVNNVHILILMARPISTKRIVETVEISRKHVGFIIHEQLHIHMSNCIYQLSGCVSTRINIDWMSYFCSIFSDLVIIFGKHDPAASIRRYLRLK